MVDEIVDTLVVGGGQAGLAMSEHLGNNAIKHVVVERDRIAERWRTDRWDSLVANGPAWHDRFPSLKFSSVGPDDFATKDMVADYFVEYAQKINAPIRCGVEVTSVSKRQRASGFQVLTNKGKYIATNVVAATGPFQQPVIPPIVPDNTAELLQIHSSTYRNPNQLPDGAVLVVGAGSSGSQIAEDLLNAGRNVYLSVGPHDRPPRRYRDRDFVWWLGVLGKWDTGALAPGTEHVTIAVSGANGGHTIDFRRFAAKGMSLVGLTRSYAEGVLHFASDLSDNIALGDANYLSVLDEADAFVERNGLNLPEEPEARLFSSDPICIREPVQSLHLKDASVHTIIWATGYAVDYPWLPPYALDEQGKPKHHRGISTEPGIYFLGLPWQTRRGSSFIWGVWHDAKFIADHIAKQRVYQEYHQNRQDR